MDERLLGLPEEHHCDDVALRCQPVPARSVSPDFPVAARLERDRNYERKPLHDSLTRRAALKGMLSAGTLALARPAAAMLPDSPADPLEISLFRCEPTHCAHHGPAVEKRRARASAGRRRAGRRFPEVSHCSPAQFLRYADHPVRAAARHGCGAIRFRFAWKARAGKLAQHLTLDPASSELRFDTGNGLLLGLGQGGPQFDRRAAPTG